MKTAHYDTATKKLLGWYDKEIHAEIPEPNIEVSDAVWQKALADNANHVNIAAKTLSIKDFRTPAQKQGDDDEQEFQTWRSARRQAEEALLRAEWRSETGRPE